MPQWRRRSQQPRTQFEDLFDERVDQMYNAMLRDAEPRKDKAGRVIREANIVPFTKLEFACWLMLQLGNRRDGVVQCTYCSAWLNVKTFTPDHAIPKSKPWYGSWDLSNLVPCCQSCNSRKGNMSADGFRALTAFTQTLDPRDANSILTRLSVGGGHWSLRNKFQKLKAKHNALF